MPSRLYVHTWNGHVKGSADETMVNEAVLRSQAKALYSIDNIGHFGLSLRNYAHFTSPIRRYSDLLVHLFLVEKFSSIPLILLLSVTMTYPRLHKLSKNSRNLVMAV